MRKSFIALILVFVLIFSSFIYILIPFHIRAVPRLVLAFYYPWYGTSQGPTGFWRHWDEGGHRPDEFLGQRRDIGSADCPVHGPYDSKNRSLIAWHFEVAEEAGIDGFIVSWWGSETFEDQAFRLMLDIAEEVETPVKLTIYYEEASGRDEAVQEIEAILEDCGNCSSFLKVLGSPVVFIYSRALSDIGLEDWDFAVRKIRDDGYEVLFIVDSFDPEVAKVFDGMHMYNPLGILNTGGNLTDFYIKAKGVAEEEAIILAATVLPGYNDTQVRDPGQTWPRDDGLTYDRAWRAATVPDPNWILICSWNEWHEGTEIESSLEYGDLYLRLTADYAERFKIDRSLSMLKVSAARTGTSWADRSKDGEG